MSHNAGTAPQLFVKIAGTFPQFFCRPPILEVGLHRSGDEPFSRVLGEHGESHAGRRTFIVNALSLGITPNIAMNWTGHSDYKAMKPYIDIVDSIKASSMAKFDGLI